MTISLPSRTVTSVDVPEVNDFSAAFRYNFFVSDESVNEKGGIPNSALVKAPGSIDAEFIQYSVSRVPRFVMFNFTPVKLSTAGRFVNDDDVRNNIFDKRSYVNIISENQDKIVTEDQFSSFDYVSVNFHDGELENKVYTIASGALKSITFSSSIVDASPFNIATLVGNSFEDVKTSFITSALTSYESRGINFFTSETPTSTDVKTTTVVKNGRSEKTKITNQQFQQLSKVRVHAQINSKFLAGLIDRALNDPSSLVGDDLRPLQSQALSAESRSRENIHVNESDFITDVPFIKATINRSVDQGRMPVEVVGYIIDKFEVTTAGQINHPPIIIENPNASLTADFMIKYGVVYGYSIRAITLVTVPGVDASTGDIASVQMLVSSRPSNVAYVKTTELVPPPPPADLNFNWDYEHEKLMVHWVFPTNSQRDIKKFQVFRRKTINEPFELLKQYDFDDSAVRSQNIETPDQKLIEIISFPMTYYIDDDFNKNSSFIYATAALDAHGMTSTYSAQYQIGFDIFKNVLTKSLISHSGAPKQYPNLYLQADTFVDTIRVSGPRSRRLKLYFNPEHHTLIDDQGKQTPVLATRQTGGSYALQFINLDNQKGASINITIDDRSTFNTDVIAGPSLTRKQTALKSSGKK